MNKNQEKFVKKEFVKLDFQSMKRFTRECELLFNFQHPCIIHIYGIFFGDRDHNPSKILSLEQKSLETAIQNKELTDEEKNRIIVEIVLGMRYVHKHNYMHRDLKPSHILLNKENHVRISGFFLAKEEKLDESQTKGIGTLRFMAPELFDESSDTKYTRKIDVYSFGIILSYIITGEYPPFSLKNIINGKTSALPENITQWSHDLIKSCLSFDPSKRPSFAEIFDILKENNFDLFSDSKGQNLTGKQIGMKEKIESRIKEIDAFELQHQ